MDGLDLAIWMAFSLIDQLKPKETRENIQHLQRCARNLLDAIESLDDYELHALHDLIGENEQDPYLRAYDRLGKAPIPYRDGERECGATVDELKELVKTTELASANAISKTEVVRGIRPKNKERLFALFVSKALKDADFHLTTYEDGIYFRVLYWAFACAFPDAGDEAYRRHGEWAKNQWDSPNKVHLNVNIGEE